MTTRRVRLYNAGYGWIITGHMVSRIVDFGGSQSHIQEHSTPPGIVKELNREAEFTGIISRMEDTLRENVTSTIKDPRTGKSREVTRTERSTSEFYGLRVRSIVDSKNPKLPLRCHVPMPDEPIRIQPGTGFAEFSRVYLEAVERHRSSNGAAASTQ
jgi:hypothetical protein